METIIMEKKLKKVFVSTFNVDESIFNEELAVGDISQWDSLGHVNLLMAVEEEFNVAFNAVDAIEVETLGDLLDLLEQYLDN